ncbi:hypothetical protein GCM10023339_34030 [Alloalcanivorax gelatiniphagus]
MTVRARLTVAAAAVTAVALLAPTPGGAVVSGTSGSGPDTVEVTGTVQVLAGENGEPDLHSLLLPSGRTIGLAGGFSAEPLTRFTGTLAVPGAGSGRTLTGSARTATLREASAEQTALPVLEAQVAEPGPAPGVTTHATYVARVTNFGSVALTNQQILAGVAAAQAYWVRESAGTIPSWTTASGVVPVASSAGSAAAGCGLGSGGADFSAITQAVGAQAFPGVDFSGASPNHLVVVVPDGCGGTVAGRGRLGSSFASGGPVIMQAEPGAGFRNVLEHELGHNVSLHHANNATAEYGNLYEVMGASPSGFTNPVLGTVYRWEQGIVAPGEVVDGTSGGSWALNPRSASTGLRSVTFIDPDTGLRHFVDFRNGTGGDAGSVYAAANDSTYYGQTFTPGIVVERENDEAGSFLLKPSTSNDGSLAGSESWTNTGGTLTVTRGAGTYVSITRKASVPSVAGGTVTMTAPTALREVSAVASGFTPSPSGLRYQWTFNGQPVPGAEGTTFRPTAAMAGGQLGLTATAYAVGRNPVSRSASQVVAPAGWYRGRTSRERPVVTGAAQVGQTLGVAGMEWVNYDGVRPADLTTAYQWYRGGTEIPGATGTSYQVVAADVGRQVHVRESPRAAGYSTASYATSAPSATVIEGRLVARRPVIGGKAKVGRKVQAKVAGWTSGTTFRYQWFVGKKAVKKADDRKLVVTRAMRGKKLVVKVTGTLPGFQKVSLRSKAAKVR